MRVVVGLRKRIVKARTAPRRVFFPRDGFAIAHLLRLVAAFSRPADILASYLRHPLPGNSFCQGIERLAGGDFTRRERPGDLSNSEIVVRANAMLHWLDGESLNGKNPYEVLNLGCSATSREIHARYRNLSKRVHPDHHSPARQRYWCERQNEINEAYRILADPQLRAHWLAELEQRRQLIHHLWEMESAGAR